MNTCVNHPDTSTRRKCYQCGKYICKVCQHLFLGRAFCSYTCMAKAIYASLLAKNASKRKKSKERSFIRRMDHPHFLWGLLGLVMISMISILVIVKNVKQKPKSITQIPLSDMVDTALADSAILGMVHELPDAMVLENLIRISGEAADSVIISLKRNGKLVAVTIPKEGQFVFEGVQLTHGENELAVLALDTHGHVKELQRMTTTYGSPRIDYLARNITRGPTSKKLIALTFDGGAGNKATEEILDALKEKNIKCTLFLTGAFIKRYPELVKRMIEDGHEIGNHTWSHPHMTTYTENRTHSTHPDINKEKVQQQLLDTAELYHNTTGHKMTPYWRAPFGEHNREIRRWAAELGYLQIGWTSGADGNMDSMDWVADTSSTSYQTAEQVFHRLYHFGDSTDYKANGAIILMHLDTQRQEDQVHHIIPAFVDSMRSRGYTFARISDMLKP